jgi:hypothetical protein
MSRPGEIGGLCCASCREVYFPGGITRKQFVLGRRERVAEPEWGVGTKDIDASNSAFPPIQVLPTCLRREHRCPRAFSPQMDARAAEGLEGFNPDELTEAAKLGHHA